MTGRRSQLRTEPGDLPRTKVNRVFGRKAETYYKYPFSIKAHSVHKKQNTMRRKQATFYKVLALGIMGVPLYSNGQSDSTTTVLDTTKVYRQDDIAFTAKRSDGEIATTGKSISVISQEDIQNSNYLSVLELLSEVTGVHVVGAGQNPGANVQSLFTRNTSSNHTLVMVDGVRITDQSSPGNAPNLAELTLADVERIEIVRGTHSTLYGSSAIGGTINIITKKGNLPGLHGNMQLQAGTFGGTTSEITENTTLTYTTKKGLYFSGSVQNQTVNGLDATVDTVTNPSTYNQRDNDNFQKLDLIGKVGYMGHKANAYIYYKYNDQTADIDDGAYTDDDNYISEFKRKSVNAGLNYFLSDKIALRYQGGYSHIYRFLEDDSSVVDANNNYDGRFYTQTSEGTSATSRIQLDYDIENLRLSTGLGYYGESFKSKVYSYSMWGPYESDNDTANIHMNIYSAFVYSEIGAGIVSDKLKDLFLTLGGRINSHSEYGLNYTYEIIPSYKLTEKMFVYGSYGTAFNAPSLYQLYNDFAGNQQLNPEMSRNIELGLKYNEPGKVFLAANYFSSRINDAVEYVDLFTNSKPIDSLTFLDQTGSSYINVNQQDNEGVEFEARFNVNKKIVVGGNMTLTNSKLIFSKKNADPKLFEDNYVRISNIGIFLTDEDYTLNDLVRRPTTRANAYASYTPIKNLSLGLRWRHVGARSALNSYGSAVSELLSPYDLLDINIRYNLDDKTVLRMRLENITNTKYNEILGYTARGFGVYWKLTYNF